MTTNHCIAVAAASAVLASAIAYSIVGTIRRSRSVQTVGTTRQSQGDSATGGPVRAGHMLYSIGINASASNSFQLGYSIYLIKRLAGLIEDSDEVTVYRVDDVCRKILDAPAPHDTDVFNAELIDKLQALSKETGTHSLQFWKDAVKSSVASRPMTLIFMTDGFEEGATASEIRELRQAGSQLAASRAVRSVYLLGVNPKMNSVWQSVFSPMGARFHMRGPVDRSTIDQIEAAADKND